MLIGREDHRQARPASTPTTSRPRRPPVTRGTTTSKTGNASRHPDAGSAGAQAFGVDPAAPVTGEQLRALMDVRRPDTGEELRTTGRVHR